MDYKYYILSEPDDFYMSAALLRELEKTGAPCYLNLRDSKKKNHEMDSYRHIDADGVVIGIVNESFLKNGMYSRFLGMVASMGMGSKVIALQNGEISEYPKKWKKVYLLDATKGLNADLLSMIKGEKSLTSDDPIISTSTPSDDTEIEPESTIEASSETTPETVFYRTDNSETIYDADADEINCQTLQRALRYLKGEGVPQDYDRALSLMKKAVAENPEDPMAQYYWGAVNYYDGGEANIEEAKSAYAKSMSLGFAPAVVSLGMLSFQMQPTNNKEAFNLFSKARENNDMKGAYGLGLLSEAEGKYDEAVEYYSEAAELGYASAQNALGCLYGEGKGVKQDYNKAYQWFQLAMDNGLVEAYVNNGLILYNSNDPKTSEMGEMCFQKAAEQGSEIAQKILDEIEAEKKEAKRQQSRRNADNHNDNGNEGNGGESAWGAFLEGLDLPSLFGEAKSRLWDNH